MWSGGLWLPEAFWSQALVLWTPGEADMVWVAVLALLGLEADTPSPHSRGFLQLWASPGLTSLEPDELALAFLAVQLFWRKSLNFCLKMSLFCFQV